VRAHPARHQSVRQRDGLGIWSGQLYGASAPARSACCSMVRPETFASAVPVVYRRLKAKSLSYDKNNNNGDDNNNKMIITILILLPRTVVNWCARPRSLMDADLRLHLRSWAMDAARFWGQQGYDKSWLEITARPPSVEPFAVAHAGGRARGCCSKGCLRVRCTYRSTARGGI